MLCTSCSHRLKPVIAIDIDGTLANYHQHLTQFGSHYLHREIDHRRFHGGEFGDWWWNEYGVDQSTYRDIKLAFRQGAQKRSMQPFMFATGFTKQFIDTAEVWITTTRPYMRLDSVDPDTRFWLEWTGNSYHHLLYDEDKYQRLSELVDPSRVVAIVDDLHDQIDLAAGVFGPNVPIWRRNPYNVNDQISFTNVAWRSSLATIAGMIRDRIAAWEERQA